MKRLMKVHYPPIGIAHITEHLEDLLHDRYSELRRIRVASVLQPKSEPHLGTLIMLMGSFAVAEIAAGSLETACEVQVDVLENSPARSWRTQASEFSVCLSHQRAGTANLARLYSQPVIEYCRWLSERTGIRWHTRSYDDMQKEPAFRRVVQQIATSPARFEPILSPSDRRLRIRPMCRQCGIVDKSGEATGFTTNGTEVFISTECPNCGKWDVTLSDMSVVIDTNAPIRTVARTVAFIEEQISTGVGTVIVNGGDWAGVWMQQVYFDALAELGFAGRCVPLNLFTPLITDESGAKLSKTIYLEEDAYEDIEPWLVTATQFVNVFGDGGLEILWREVRGWAEEPKKWFRDYSVAYLRERLQA